MSADLSVILPRILIVSRRSVRKNKFIDFVGEYHLDLIVRYGAVPVIVPRVSGMQKLLDSFEPIHGVLLCEGEDIDPSLYQSDTNISGLSLEELKEIKRLHATDTSIDKEKDTIELRLAKLCLERNIPYLGICRGSQVLNVACGGTLYQDIETELSNKIDSYLDQEKMEINVNSYHHQGVKRLAERFVPMAYAPDGLIEGYYDPYAYNPEEGKFIMGLQFHPERMRRLDYDEFDYPGCPVVYQKFVKAVIAYQKKLNSSATSVREHVTVINQKMEKKRKVIVRSFSLSKDIYIPNREL